MSKGSGGTGAGKPLTGDDSGARVSIKNVESLQNMTQNDAYREMKSAISRFETTLGIHQRSVKLADLSAGVMGVHVTANGESAGVYLSKSYFKNKTAEQIRSSMQGMYKDAWQTKTNKPVAHVITHEMAHSVWNAHMTSEKAQKAGAEVRALYKTWMKDPKRESLGYGKYSKTNVSEFFAETATKAVHGSSDKYTTALKKIVKKYDL